MKIAVCMKQVPRTTEGNMDKKTGVLIRAGLEAVVNVYDLAALEAALQIRKQSGGEIHVYTMGPAKAEEAIRTAFAMGADEGFLITDSAFAGADVLATSYTLMQAIQKEGGYDLILCGKQTTDGDTAQVSGALAKWMALVHLNWVTEIRTDGSSDLKVTYLMEGRDIEARTKLPCLLSVEKDSFIPRMPSLKLKISGRKKEIHHLALADFADQDTSHYGLNGSATRVKRIFPPARTKRQELQIMEKEQAVGYIMDIIDGWDWRGQS